MSDRVRKFTLSCLLSVWVSYMAISSEYNWITSFVFFKSYHLPSLDYSGFVTHNSTADENGNYAFYMRAVPKIVTLGFSWLVTTQQLALETALLVP